MALMSPHTRFVYTTKRGQKLAYWFASDLLRTKFAIPEALQITFGLPAIATEKHLAEAGFSMFH